MRCPECEEKTSVPDPPGSPELQCLVCSSTWIPSLSDPAPGWRVPSGAPALWAQLQADYESDKLHKVFIEHCHRAGALDYAARRYRRRLESSEGNDAQAKKSLMAVQQTAVSTLEAKPKTLARLVDVIRLTVTLSLGLVIALGVWLVLAKLGVVP